MRSLRRAEIRVAAGILAVIVFSTGAAIAGTRNSSTGALISIALIIASAAFVLATATKHLRSHWIHPTAFLVVTVYAGWIAWKACVWMWGDFPD